MKFVIDVFNNFAQKNARWSCKSLLKWKPNYLSLDNNKISIYFEINWF